MIIIWICIELVLFYIYYFFGCIEIFVTSYIVIFCPDIDVIQVGIENISIDIFVLYRDLFFLLTNCLK